MIPGRFQRLEIRDSTIYMQCFLKLVLKSSSNVLGSCISNDLLDLPTLNREYCDK